MTKRNPIYRQLEWAQEIYFKEQKQRELLLQKAVSALEFLASGGVVNTPDLFWTRGSGELLIDRILRAKYEREERRNG